MRPATRLRTYPFFVQEELEGSGERHLDRPAYFRNPLAQHV